MNSSPAQIDNVASERTAAVFEYLRAMREVSEAQRQVMLQYLGDSAASVPVRASIKAAPARRALTVGAVTGAGAMGASTRTAVTASVAPKAVAATAVRKATRTTRPPPKSGVVARANMTALEALTAIVSERTGYPKEMLDQDLDMEADLGIDSIKRIEILGQMRDRLGLGAMNESARSDALEELARVKTLRKIAEWLDARTGTPAARAANVSEAQLSAVA